MQSQARSAQLGGLDFHGSYILVFRDVFVVVKKTHKYCPKACFELAMLTTCPSLPCGMSYLRAWIK